MQMISGIKETFRNSRKGAFYASFHFEHSFLLLLKKNQKYMTDPNFIVVIPRERSERSEVEFSCFNRA